MNKVFILCFLCGLSLFGINLSSQNYIPFPDSNYVWNDYYTIYEAPCIPYGQRQFYISGDTLINSNVYHKLYVNESTGTLWCPGQNLGQYLHVLVSCIRQDTSLKQVYAFNSSSLQDTLLFDFNLSIGTVYPKTLFTDDSVIYVTRIDTTLLGDGLNHKIFFFSRFQPCFDSISNDLALIEGVGFTTGFGFQTVGASQPLSIYGTGLLAPEAPQLECFGTMSTLHGRVTSNGNCQRDTTFYNALDNPCLMNMAIENSSSDPRISIQPNPSHKEIVIVLSENAIGSDVVILNCLGQIMYQTTITSTQTLIDVFSYSSGIYYVILAKDQQKSFCKFIKQ